MQKIHAGRFDVVVIGQGYAGLTAAKLSVKRGFRTATFEGQCFGGLIINVNQLDPTPDDAEQAGFELASNLAQANALQGVVSFAAPVTAVEAGEGGVWLVKTSTDIVSVRHVIVASGASLRKLGIPGEKEFFGRGVSECADCDGPLYQGMQTIIVGGGDAAFQETLALSEYANLVTMLIRGERPRARADLRERVASLSNVTQLTNTRLVAIDGAPDAGVASVKIETNGMSEKVLACSGVFIFIGIEPRSSFLPAGVARDPSGALITSDLRAASIPGLWAIGAVRSGYGGLLTDGAVDAEQAVSNLS